WLAAGGDAGWPRASWEGLARALPARAGMVLRLGTRRLWPRGDGRRTVAECRPGRAVFSVDPGRGMRITGNVEPGLVRPARRPGRGGAARRLAAGGAGPGVAAVGATGACAGPGLAAGSRCDGRPGGMLDRGRARDARDAVAVRCLARRADAGRDA